MSQPRTPVGGHTWVEHPLSNRAAVKESFTRVDGLMVLVGLLMIAMKVAISRWQTRRARR
jgi:hypothetical protein